jgi:serine protease Do
LDINSGIVVTSLKNGKLKDIGIKKGFIITAVNKKPINEVNDFKREIGNGRGGIFLEGVYPDGEYAYYVLPAGNK